MANNTGRTSVDWDACLQRLTAGARQLKLRTSPQARAQMIGYLKHLESWNSSYNLTAVRNPQDMVVRHLLDCLSAIPYVKGERIVDVGSGPGLPGIVLALSQPKKSFTLIESNGKKAAFLRHVVRTLSLPNVAVVQERSDDYRPERSFDTVICRALAAADLALKMAGHLCAPGGRFVLMKGRDPAQELEEIQSGFRVADSVRIAVPELDAERHIVVLEPGLL